MSLSESLEIASATDPGMVRSHNEDSIASDASRGLAVLADGMGGYNAGEVASGIATTVITTELQQLLETTQLVRFRSADHTAIRGERNPGFQPQVAAHPRLLRPAQLGFNGLGPKSGSQSRFQRGQRFIRRRFGRRCCDGCGLGGGAVRRPAPAPRAQTVPEQRVSPSAVAVLERCTERPEPR